MSDAEHTHSPSPEEIMEYLDGEGTAGARTAIEGHLVSCRSCQAIASEQRELSDDAAAWRVEPAPSSLRAPAAPRPRLFPLRLPAWTPSRPLLMAAAAVAAVVVLMLPTLPWFQLQRRGPATVAFESSGELQQSRKAATPAPGLAVDSIMAQERSSVRLGGARTDAARAAAMEQDAPGQSPVRTAAIIRTATLQVVVKAFDNVRQSVEGIVADAGGFVDQMTVTGDAGTARALNGVLRIPADRLGGVADRLRGLGQVVEDSQGSQDVSDQLVDIAARLASARATERRLTELLRDRTGKLSDVLEVERELARVRIDIERLDAETTNLGRRVSYATISISITEERRAGLDPGPLSLASRVRVAAADGLESALESLAWTVLFVLRAGPFLALWAIVFGSAWLIVRRVRAPKIPD